MGRMNRHVLVPNNSERKIIIESGAARQFLWERGVIVWLIVCTVAASQAPEWRDS